MTTYLILNNIVFPQTTKYSEHKMKDQETFPLGHVFFRDIIIIINFFLVTRTILLS